MKNIDIGYLAGKMSDMSGLPIRIVRNGKITDSFSVIPMTGDPVILCLDTLLKIKEHVAYHITPEYLIYGILNAPGITLVIGPSFNNPPSRQEIHDLAFRLNVNIRDFDAFSGFIKSIVPMPLESILQMLCTMNHILNGEKLNLGDVLSEQLPGSEIRNAGAPSRSSDIYRVESIEKQLTDIVTSGDTERLREWIREVPSVRTGTIADSFIRQNKNNFIVTTALVSRAAVRAGMDLEDAYRMSDSFILMCENAKTAEEISSLYISMLTGYTGSVAGIKKITEGSALKNDVLKYVTHHISETITTDDVAEHLFMSRSHLSTLFKKTCGEELSRYIQMIKIERSKELLPDRNRTITQISDYLGYSSSSHFTRVFKSITGMTPAVFRKNIRY